MSEQSELRWIKSSFCESGNCVEIASTGAQILIRDSKQPQGPHLEFTRQEWEAFEAGMGRGDFRLI